LDSFSIEQFSAVKAFRFHGAIPPMEFPRISSVAGRSQNISAARADHAGDGILDFLPVDDGTYSGWGVTCVQQTR